MSMSDFKTKFKNGYDKTKVKIKSYGDSIKDAYNRGYSAGWQDCTRGDSAFGTSLARGIGYANGFSAKKKSIKRESKASKYQRV